MKKLLGIILLINCLLLAGCEEIEFVPPIKDELTVEDFIEVMNDEKASFSYETTIRIDDLNFTVNGNVANGLIETKTVYEDYDDIIINYSSFCNNEVFIMNEPNTTSNPLKAVFDSYDFSYIFLYGYLDFINIENYNIMNSYSYFYNEQYDEYALGMFIFNLKDDIFTLSLEDENISLEIKYDLSFNDDVIFPIDIYCDNNVLYVLKDNEYTLEYSSHVIQNYEILSSINNIPVTKLSYRSFINRNKLETLYIPSSINSIDSNAFKSNETTIIYCSISKNEADIKFTENWNNSLNVIYDYIL
ncbi:MAG: hypothetical protein R3Y05_06305 [bacterium]